MKNLKLLSVLFTLLLCSGFLMSQTNRALDFDGTDDWVEIPESNELDISTNLTISAWVMTRDNITAKIVEKETWNSGWTIGQDKWNGWKAGFFGESGGGTTIYWSDGIPVYNQWYHLALTISPTSIKLYVDGNLKASQNISDNIKLNNEPISIASDEGSQKFFDGTIDELRIWDKELSQSQIQAMKDDYVNSTTIAAGLSMSDLVAYYTFDEALGETSVYDETSNNIDGSLKNMNATDDRILSTAFDSDDSSLPVELISFLAENSNNSVSLNWSTASELNNKCFVIESSRNAYDFKEIGKVYGQGNSNTVVKYSFIDYNPENDITYYRLKQIDFNGTFEYSNVISIKTNNEINYKVYPNPTANNLTIEGVNKSLIKIYNSSGADVTSLINFSGFDGSTILELGALNTGFYFINIDGKMVKIQKVE